MGTSTPQMALSKPTKGEADWDDDLNTNCDKIDPLGVDHYTGAAGTGYHKNTLHVGDGAASDKRISFENDWPAKPYIGFDDGDEKCVFSNDGSTELEVAKHVKMADLWVVSQQSGDDTNGDGSWNKPYATVSKAVTEAGTGDVILVLPGAYSLGGSTLTISKVVHILGLGPREGVVISGTGATYVIDLQAAATLEGIYVLMTGSTGGQIAVRIGAYGVRMRNVEIRNNSTGANSHALLCAFGANTKVEDCEVYAYNGYALKLAMGTETGGAKFRLCKFTSGTSVGVYLADTYCLNMVFDRCNITGGTGTFGIQLAALITGTVVKYCVVKGGGSGAETIHVSEAMTLAIFFCAFNEILDTDITNSIGTPYNVVDADVS
ncbi:MAG: hypothetical protein Q8Q12_00455 [bacterium]|nr:hypothetical protein [bacterium]